MYNTMKWGSDFGVADRVRLFKFPFSYFFSENDPPKFKDSWNGLTGAEFDKRARAIINDRRVKLSSLAVDYWVSHDSELFGDLGKGDSELASEIEAAVNLLRENGHEVIVKQISDEIEADPEEIRKSILYLCTNPKSHIDGDISMTTRWYVGDVTDAKMVLQEFSVPNDSDVTDEDFLTPSTTAKASALTSGEHIKKVKIEKRTLESLNCTAPSVLLNYFLTEIIKNMARRINYYDAICAQDVIMTKDAETQLIGVPIKYILQRTLTGEPLPVSICHALVDANPNFWFQRATEQESIRMRMSSLDPETLFALKNVRYQTRKTIYLKL